MIRKLTILILFLFLPFLGFLLRLTGEETADVVSKVIKIFLVYLIVIIVLSYKKFNLVKDIKKYFTVLILFSVPYLFHFIFSKSNIEKFNTYAFNELVVIFYFFIGIIITSIIFFYISDYLFLIWIMSFVGIILSMQSIWFALNYTPERYVQLFVLDVLRAGAEVTDPNLLRAVLNIFSISSLTIYFLYKSLFIKLFAFLTFLLIQAGGMLTFSNAGFLSIVISLFTLYFLIGLENRKKYVLLVSLILFFALISIVISGAGDILFYRLKLSDQATLQSSIYSRIAQYEAFLDLIKNKPAVVLTGVGSAMLPEKLGIELTLHNSLLRPLAIGGILSFIGYLYLFYLTFSNFRKAIKYISNDKLKTISIFFFAGFLGWTFQSLTLPFECSGVNIFFFTIAYSLKNTVMNSLKNMVMNSIPHKNS